MKITAERIRYLLQAYTSRTATAGEEAELFQWVATQTDDPIAGAALLKDHVRSLIKTSGDKEDPSVDWEALYRKILARARIGMPVRRLERRVAVAATAALLLAAGSIYLWHPRGKTPAAEAVTAPASQNDIGPGGRKAILKAAGTRVLLNKQDTSFILAGNTVHIRSGGLRIAEAKPVQYTLEIPAGGEYSLTLADGTKVWLNAASTLQYPSVFSGSRREVTLEGEAYFEVKDDPGHPFVVHTARQNIRVLGTEFNIQAYGDEKKAITTLVRGKVSVQSGGQSTILAPGEQALSGDDGALTHAENADVAMAVAWKNGYFQFDKADIHAIMQQLSRWYDVKVIYQPGLHPHLFGAMIDRDNRLSGVLNMLEETGEVHFQITGKEVIVMP